MFTAEARAKFTKWVLWANSSLDPICFVENERGQVMGTSVDQPGRAGPFWISLMASIRERLSGG